MKNDKAFTLVEVLAVLTILALVVVITVPSLADVLTKAGNKTMKEQEKIIIDSAKKYVQEYSPEFSQDNDLLLNFEDLKNSEFLEDKEYFDPETGESLTNLYIYVSKEDTKFDYSVLYNFENINETSENTCFLYSGNRIIGYNKAKSGCANQTNMVFPTSIDGNLIKNIAKPVSSDKNYVTDITETIDFNNLLYLETIEKEALTRSSGNQLEIELIDLSNNINLETIGDSAFEKTNTFGIKKVILPKNLKRIEKEAFASNELTEIILPDKLYSLGDQAFYNTDIKTITLPKSVMVVGQKLFLDSEIEEVVVLGKESLYDFELCLSNTFEGITPTFKP